MSVLTKLLGSIHIAEHVFELPMNMFPDSRPTCRFYMCVVKHLLPLGKSFDSNGGNINHSESLDN